MQKKNYLKLQIKIIMDIKRKKLKRELVDYDMSIYCEL